ncbi:hypothetical protein GCM10009609_74340 [Pseudonocardia aurantiaca]|uniref:Peptidase C39-like domain-containing protein n=1 Tax=Pseudonocardia aurantiaca TaxID=75290 RepID=A0ABW4FJ52_9PSEU
MVFPYVGSGPYCYANSAAMLMGVAAPEPSAIEVLTGSPFGLSLHEGLAYFDPLGWNPEIGLDTALDLLGWTCERVAGGSAADAVRRLRDAGGPVLAGPVEIGLLRHHPGSGTPVESDHFVVVIGAEDGHVHFHDPHGYPFSTLPVAEFTAAWESVSFAYPAVPFTMRSDFRRVRAVDVPDALRASLPAARQWLAPAGEMPAAAALRFADLVEDGLTPGQEAPRPFRRAGGRAPIGRRRALGAR